MRPPSPFTWALATVGIVGGCLLAAHCDNGDSPLPALAPCTGVSVSPCQWTFPVTGGDAGPPAPQVFVVQALAPGGLGADSVPLSVSVGSCPDASSACGTGTDSTNTMFDWNRIALVAVDGGGCSSNSTQTLSCTLSAAGLASFGVATPLPIMSTDGVSIPICVRPITGGPSTVVPVRIASAVDGGTLIFDSLDASVPPEIQGSDCLSVSACPLRQFPIRLQLYGSGDASTSAQVAQQPIEVLLSLTLNSGSSGIWLSTTSCAQSAAQPTALDTEFPSGATTAQVGNLCVNDHDMNLATGAIATLTVKALSDPTLTSTTNPMNIAVAPQPARVTFSTQVVGGQAQMTPIVTACNTSSLPASATIQNVVGVGSTQGQYDAGVFYATTLPEGGASLQVEFANSNAACVVHGVAP
jgi:hypothetical protein